MQFQRSMFIPEIIFSYSSSQANKVRLIGSLIEKNIAPCRNTLQKEYYNKTKQNI